jgi:acetoin utilization protein AcuB
MPPPQIAVAKAARKRCASGPPPRRPLRDRSDERNATTGATSAKQPGMDKPTIRQYMTPSPFTIGADQKLTVASEIMRAHRIRHLPVLRGGELVGILSQRDVHLIASLPSVDLAEVPVEDAMTDEVYDVAPETPIEEVAAVMAAHKYGAALIVDKGHVTGVFTTVDALQALADGGAKPKRARAARR